MALLDRLKERVETDLSDGELQAMLDEIDDEIVDRFGPEGEITIHLDTERELEGDKKMHRLVRPLDETQPVTVVEIEPASVSGAANETTLDASDYRILHRGRTIERLESGPNGRTWWAQVAKITYTPISTQSQRDEVAIRVSQLQIEARGVDAERVGDVSVTFADVEEQREKLLNTLSPRKGLVMA